MNPILQMMMANQRPNGQNMMMRAMTAMMSGQTPQQFLRSLPELNGMDLNNIQNTAQQLCQNKGINYEQAKAQISNQLAGMK